MAAAWEFLMNFSHLLLRTPLSAGIDLCYSLKDRKSYLPKVYGNPWNHFRLSAGSSSCWFVVTFLCQAPRQRDNSQLTLLALFLQHHGVLPSLKHVPLTHSCPLKAFLGTSLMLMGTGVSRN